MFHNRPVSETRHSSRTDAPPFGRDGEAAPGRSGPRTVGGLALTAVVPVALLAAASYPVAFAAVVVAAAGAFGVVRHARGGRPPGGATRRSNVQTSDRNRTATTAD